MTTFVLSVEEVAFGMGYLGGIDAAASYLDAIVGKLSADELTGRLTAASHALLARGLLVLDPQDVRAPLDPALSQAISAIMKADNSLRMTITSAGVESATTFFLDGALPVAHRLVQEVVSYFAVLDDFEAVAAEITGTICLGVADGLFESTVLGTTPADALRQARLKAARAPAAELVALLGGNLQAAALARIVSDMKEAGARWGTVLRLEANANGIVEANKGFFTIAVEDHGWLFDMGRDPARVDVFPLNAATVSQATMRLLTSTVQI